MTRVYNVSNYGAIYVYGQILPAKGIHFRYVNGLILDNVKVGTIYPDIREEFVFHNIEGIYYEKRN